MASWLEVREYQLDAVISIAPPIPLDHKEVTLRKPYGKGNYTLKYKEIRRSTNTTLVLAYNRLVSICHAQTPSGSYMKAIPVEPYERRIKTYWIERQERYEDLKKVTGKIITENNELFGAF